MTILTSVSCFWGRCFGPVLPGLDSCPGWCGDILVGVCQFHYHGAGIFGVLSECAMVLIGLQIGYITGVFSRPLHHSR